MVDAPGGGVVVVRDGDVLAETLAEFVLAERGAHGGHRAAQETRQARGVRRRGVRTERRGAALGLASRVGGGVTLDAAREGKRGGDGTSGCGERSGKRARARSTAFEIASVCPLASGPPRERDPSTWTRRRWRCPRATWTESTAPPRRARYPRASPCSEARRGRDARAPSRCSAGRSDARGDCVHSDRDLICAR